MIPVALFVTARWKQTRTSRKRRPTPTKKAARESGLIFDGCAGGTWVRLSRRHGLPARLSYFFFFLAFFFAGILFAS
jgi:hypothetical protein